MDTIGNDCENLIMGYKTDLEDYEKHIKDMKGVIDKVENYDIETENAGEYILFDTCLQIDIYQVCNKCKNVNIHFSKYDNCEKCNDYN